MLETIASTAVGMQLTKSQADTANWAPFEEGTVTVLHQDAVRIVISDAARRPYFEHRVKPGKTVKFTARGSAGMHSVELFNNKGKRVALELFRLRAATQFHCNKGNYAKIAERIKQLMEKDSERRVMIINGKSYRMLVCWGRDHVHTLKSQKYFMDDVKTGLDYWLDTQEENGMVWDCIYPNGNYPAPTWFGEALGEGYFRYDDNMKWIVRRIPVEADCEFLYTEGVWYAWKASGDDAWMAKQLPRLEKALKYNNSNPARWSEQHGLVRRSFCQDSWDFVNPHYCNGDHRCINPGDPQFLFHSDNSGLYASYWRMAEMYEALGGDDNLRRAGELRAEGEALRQRANDKLFFGRNYGHMIPETLPEEEVYALVGDERERMSLSTGYTINRKLPTHEMAVAILNEYQRRRKEKEAESFAEWWTMDPPYTPEQWPSQHTGAGCPWGEYMNGAICTIIAGEVSKAAFDHGCEEYGADIIDRVWALSERDGGQLHQAYRRLPEQPVFEKASFQAVDLRAVVNRGLQHGAYPAVEAWTGEGDNDMRNLPTGKQTFGLIKFNIIDPAKNDGRAVLRISAANPTVPANVTIPVNNLTGKSLYFLHTLSSGHPTGTLVATYDVVYADGVTERMHVRAGHEISGWWGPSDGANQRGSRTVDTNIARLAWRGPNPEWKDVGIFMTGWNNPRPNMPITAIRLEAAPSKNPKAGILLAGISVSDHPVFFEERIRSYGLPDNWAQAAVFYAVAEGLAGVEDQGRAFDKLRLSPRWSASAANEADITLHYPASDGYVSYRYRDNKKGKITLEVTGSFKDATLHCLLPAGAQAKRVTVAGAEVPFMNVAVENSTYADITLETLPLGPVVIAY